ncbi:MAG TPA: MATE family efflux transporter [Chlamydiales bacterium]|nr:MATE family efflux transporter [Chlamydiales bacterium]
MQKSLETSPSKREAGNFWILFLPLVGTTLSNYLFQLLEKLFLTRVSKEALQAALNATYVCQIPQLASIAVVMMAQVFVARWYSAREYQAIGPGLWQFIWFSLISMFITVPASLFCGHWYFQGTGMETTALPYLYLLTSFNFIYPLNASLSCFFLGMGKTRLILFVNIADQVIKIFLGYLFIFGMDPWIPTLGILGGALSNLIAQGIFCLILGSLFLQTKYRELYHTHRWKFELALFWNCIQSGLFRACNRIFGYGCWILIARLMSTKGSDHLLILSIGGTLTLFFPFLFEAIYQAQTIVVSHLLGANKIAFLTRAARSSLILIIGITILSAFPLLGFPSFTFACLFPGISLDPQSIAVFFLGIWLWFVYFTFTAIPLSYVFAFKDTKFYFYAGVIFRTTDYCFMYLFINQLLIAPKYFWIVLSLVQMTSTLPIYYWRMRFLCKRDGVSRQTENSQLPASNLGFIRK